MTYNGTIDEDKQLILSRPLSEMDKKLIRVAYLNPEMRVATLMIVADDSAKLNQFAGNRKWKNPETSNLISFDTVLGYATKDRMWAKAIVKKVQEEYKKDEASKGGGGGGGSQIQNKIVKKLKGEVENEIKKFKGGGKNISNAKDRAEFEAYLDEKLRPAQEELYKQKIEEALKLPKEEYDKATKGLVVKGVWDTIKTIIPGTEEWKDKDWKDTEPSNWGTSLGVAGGVASLGAIKGLGATALAFAGASTTGTLATVGGALAATTLTPLVAIGAVLGGGWKLWNIYKNTKDGGKQQKLLEDFNKKKEDIIKKIDRDKRYENIGKEESANEGMKEFFKDEKFEDSILGDDLTVEELLDLSENGDNEEKERAKKILDEKKKEYMGSKYTREKFLIQETKGKKFKSPEGKRVTVKEMLDLEESGDGWATEKLKDLRHTIEGIEEEGEDDTPEETEKKIIRDKQDLNRFRSMSMSNLDQEIALTSVEDLENMEKDLQNLQNYDFGNTTESIRPRRLNREKTQNRRVKKRPSKEKSTSNSSGGISSEDAQVVLEAISKIRKEQGSMEEKYKNDSFERPDGKSVSFNTLKKYFGNKDSNYHDWAKNEWKKLKKNINKTGAEKEDDQDKEINKIVKEKFEGALTVDPNIIELFKAITTNGKFDQKKLDDVMKGVSELSKVMNQDKKKKKASIDRASLIKLAYNNPERRSEILKLLIK